jgi:serine-type D-Ala-D-Ala carboxypeptidase
VAGSIPAFVQQMNARAAQLGCTSTRFSCPHGLYDDGNVSNAQDMAKIAIACAQYELYRQIADTLQYEIPATNLHAARSIRSTNKMLNPENSCYRAYIHGMKTGFTTKAGRCYVTAAQQGDSIYGLVILGSDLKNIYAEAAAILDWAFAGCPQPQAAA